MSRPRVLFPDAVAVAVAYLQPALAAAGRPVPVYSRVPDPRPGEFVRVARVGGVRRSLIVDAARLDVHAWAATEQAAQGLAQLCRALIHAMGGARPGTTVYRVDEVGGPQWLPDDQSGTPRYATAYEIHLRGAPLP